MQKKEIKITKKNVILIELIIDVGTNDLRSSQDPETIAKNIIDIAKNSMTNKNEILV